jgi:hypothetical protein
VNRAIDSTPVELNRSGLQDLMSWYGASLIHCSSLAMSCENSVNHTSEIGRYPKTIC